MKYIEKKNKIINDKYTEYIYNSFDIQNKEETTVKIPINFSECKSFDWNIGVIYGGSGTGKTTLLKEFGNLSKCIFDEEKPVISNFDWLEPNKATLLLSSMGLSSVPTWLRPFQTLSNGEQYRAELAYKVGKAKENETILIDEYTSVVDRDVAKAMSNALQKYIRRNNKKIILASCHFDIMEWLLPDWTYSPLKGRVEKPSLLRQSRPKIELQIFRCRYETWNIFKQHHYISEDLNKAAKCFCVTWNDKPVAFYAFLPMPSGTVQNAFRGSRSVVLPDYQGLGIGFSVAKYLHKLYTKDGKKLYVKSVNPALVKKRMNDDDYKFNGKTKSSNEGGKLKGRKLRDSAAYSFLFTGKVDDIKENELNILKFNADAWKNVSQNQTRLF
jgi:ABC-type lipoprotein export system ATPase subunit|tara:strand:- start:4596 stop:5750 length:1155 start_codon:yes stop_codon:yes gene_type:complete